MIVGLSIDRSDKVEISLAKGRMRSTTAGIGSGDGDIDQPGSCCHGRYPPASVSPAHRPLLMLAIGRIQMRIALQSYLHSSDRPRVLEIWMDGNQQQKICRNRQMMVGSQMMRAAQKYPHYR